MLRRLINCQLIPGLSDYHCITIVLRSFFPFKVKNIAKVLKTNVCKKTVLKSYKFYSKFKK